MVIPDRLEDLTEGGVLLQSRGFRRVSTLFFSLPRGGRKRACLAAHASIPRHGGHYHLSLARSARLR